AIIIATTPISTQTPNKGSINRNHFTQDTPATAILAIKIPEVGAIVLVNPSPILYASTAVCLVIPIISAKGAIIGITIAACPLPDVIIKLNRRLKKNIPNAPTITGKGSIKDDIEFTTVSSIRSEERLV